MAPITHDVQTLQQHVEQPRMHKTQSSTTIDNIRNKGTNNSVADVLSHASPHPHRSTDVRPEDVTPLHVLSDSIPADQSCLDSVQTEAKKDGTSTRRQRIIVNYRCTNQSMCSSTLIRQHGRRQTSLGHPQKTTRGATRSNYQPDNASPGIVATYGQIVEQHLMHDNEPDQMPDREPRGPRRSARESHAPRRLRYNQLGQPSY